MLIDTSSEILLLHDLAFKPYLSEQRIRRRVKSLGKQLMTDYQDKNPLFLSVLNGSFIFTADLMRAFKGDCEVRFVQLSSYIGAHSSGKVATVIGIEADIVENRHVIIVEDIVDTGKTMFEFMKTLSTFAPKSIALVSLLLKPEVVRYPVSLDYIGFNISDEFVVGYGLDYNGLGRNLKGIYQKV